MENNLFQNATLLKQDEKNISIFLVGNQSIHSDEPLGPPLYITVTSTVLYCLIFLIGVVGNITVIIVIKASHSLKTTVNKYLLNLCVADVLVIFVCMPTALADIYTKEVWYFGEVMCKLVPFLENAVANASVLTILAISIERYRVICYPLKGVDEGAVRVWKIVLFIWIISLISSVPWFSIATLRPSTFYDGTPIQVCRNPIIKEWQKIFVVGLSVFFFFIPSVMMLLLNCHLCRALNKTQEYDSCIHGNRRERVHQKRQVANTIASIVSIFFICHLPFRVAVLWFSFEDKNVIWGLGLERYLLILYSTRIMFYTNHALNPVVYNFVSSKFRCAFHVLCRKTSWKKCCVLNSIYRRLSFPTVRRTRSDTPNQRTTVSNKGMGTNQIILGQLDDAGAGNAPRTVLVEYPCGGQQANKVVVTNSPYNSKDSSSSDGAYKVRIQIEDQRLAIKFKVERIASL